MKKFFRKRCAQKTILRHLGSEHSKNNLLVVDRFLNNDHILKLTTVSQQKMRALSITQENFYGDSVLAGCAGVEIHCVSSDSTDVFAVAKGVPKIGLSFR